MSCFGFKAKKDKEKAKIKTKAATESKPSARCNDSFSDMVSAQRGSAACCTARGDSRRQYQR